MRNDDPLRDAESRMRTPAPTAMRAPVARWAVASYLLWPLLPLTARLRWVPGALTGLLDDRDRRRVAVAAVVCCLGLVTFAQAQAGLTGDRDPGPIVARSGALDSPGGPDPTGGPSATGASPSAAGTADPDIAAGATLPAEPTAPAGPTSPAGPAPSIAPAGPEKIEHRIDPGPVAGLTLAQMNNAKAIVRTGRDLGMPRRALIIAVATAMQESNLYNYASGVLPESQNYPHEAIGWDHDSVGLFQQRPSMGWGPVARLMEPAFATAQFLAALRRVPGWERLALADAAQAVQVSAFPYAYAQHEARATTVVDAIVPGWA